MKPQGGGKNVEPENPKKEIKAVHRQAKSLLNAIAQYDSSAKSKQTSLLAAKALNCTQKDSVNKKEKPAGDKTEYISKIKI